MCSHYSTHAQEREISKAGNGSLLNTLFQVVFGLPIAFLASVDGIEMKSAAPVPEDNVVSLKA